MAQTLEEQIDVIERSLGERMIEHALVIIRAWLFELGENNPYEQAFLSIQQRSKELFASWLTLDDEHIDEQLDELTGETYQMVDAVYVDIRLKRGIAPNMHGFNEQNPQSVNNYFRNAVRFRPEDLEWFHDVLYAQDQTAIAMIAIVSMTQNVRNCFSQEMLLAIIDGIKSPNELVADQCLANVLTLLVQYDLRIDYFPALQQAFVEAIEEIDNGEEKSAQILCALAKSSDKKWMDSLLDQMYEKIPEIRTESEYLTTIITVLPNTWIYELLMVEHEERVKAFAICAIEAGMSDLLFDFPTIAEPIYRKILRDKKKKPKAADYMHYAHCLLLKGDRMMAFEYYKQARQMSGGAKEFFAIFRPDRKALVDHGVPLEQVYLLEDQLINT